MDFAHAVPLKLATSMLQLVMEQLTSSPTKEIAKIWKVDKELEDLQATYEKIKAILDNCDRNWLNNGTALESWLQDLEGYCYDTEDIVDLLSLSFQPKAETDKTPIRNQILASIFKRWKTPHKIAELRANMEYVHRKIQGVLEAGQNNPAHPLVKAPRVHQYTNSLSDKTLLVSGTSRDQDKEAIIQELTSLRRDSYGVSIVGLDGLGKTALVRTILADKAITDHFAVILSTSISGYFQVEDVVQKLADNHFKTMRHPRAHQADQMLEDILRNQRALIVLDDLWSVADQDWEVFKCNYLNPQDWKILATTRNPKVAEVTQSLAYYLNTMTDEDCMELILEQGRWCGSDCEFWKNDVEIIAKKCKGMPIIANKLALTLSKKRTMDELTDAIRQLKNNNLWELPEFIEVFPFLKLNEPKMPPYLKRCFAYCSLFPPNHEFNKDDLIQLWEVEGFVQPRGSLPTGNQCFDDLLSRSILQPIKSSKQKQLTYKMHEFNFKFAQLLSCHAFRRIEEGTTNLLSSKNIRHVSFSRKNIDVPLLKKLEECKRLRTFILLHKHEAKKCTISYTFFQKLESLRLLDLSHSNGSKLLKPLSPLKHLRYLDLSDTEVQTLPEPISSLRALQVLKLDNCSKLDRLPKDLNQLISLTQLHVNMKLLARLPSNLGMLTNLETLSSYVVGKSEGNKVAELKNMVNLTEICICRLENINSKKEAEESKLSKKPMLKGLVLEWDTLSVEMVNTGDVLDGLEPNNDLKDLTMRNYKCRYFPKWIISPTRRLVNIYLENCQDCKVLPSLGQLPLLKTLVLHSFHDVEIVDRRFCGQGEIGFPRLESVEFLDMERLLYWIGLEDGDMPCLLALKISDCPRLAYLPSLNHQSLLVDLEINNCPTIKSLPEIPSSLNGKDGKLIITDSPLIDRRCHVGGADWPKIKDIPCIKTFYTKTTSTASVSPSLSQR